MKKYLVHLSIAAALAVACLLQVLTTQAQTVQPITSFTYGAPSGTTPVAQPVVSSTIVRIPALGSVSKPCVIINDASGTVATQACTAGGGGSTTIIIGINGITVQQVGTNATASLDTTFSASWSALETFLKGLTVNGTTTLASSTSCAYLSTNASSQVQCMPNIVNSLASSSQISVSAATGTGISFSLIQSYLTAAVQTLAGISTTSIQVNPGTGISVATTTNAITIGNTGVTSLTGAGCVTASNTTGTVTLTVTCISTSTFNATGTGNYVIKWNAAGTGLSTSSQIYVNPATGQVTISANATTTSQGSVLLSYSSPCIVLGDSSFPTSTVCANANGLQLTGGGNGRVEITGGTTEAIRVNGGSIFINPTGTSFVPKGALDVNGSVNIGAPLAGTSTPPTNGLAVAGAVIASSSLTVNGTSTYNATATFNANVSTTIPNALVLSNASSVLTNYAGSSCSGGQAATGVSATGTVACGTFATSTGTGGITSINTATSSAQTIVATSTGIAVTTTIGATNSTTSIQNTGVTSFVGQGCVTAANSTGTVGLTVTCISANQLITFSLSQDATGTATGTTAINVTSTVIGLEGKVLPSLATGTLFYSGSALHWGNGVDASGNPYVTSTGLSAITINGTSSNSFSLNGSGNVTSTVTGTSTTFFLINNGVASGTYNCANVTVASTGLVTSIAGGSCGTGGVSTSTPNTWTAAQTFSGGILNASGTHIGVPYVYLVSPVANEGDFTTIQPAITADCALANPGLIIFKGSYTVGTNGSTTAGLAIPSTCSGIGLRGLNESSTNISYLGSGDAIDLGDTAGSLQYGELGNFKLTGNANALAGVRMWRAQTANVHDIFMTGFTKTSTSSYDLQGKGLVLDGAGSLNADNFISNLHIDHTDLDILVASTSNANIFLGMDLYGQSNPSSTLVYLQNGVGNTMQITNMSSAKTGIFCSTQHNTIVSGYNELLTTGVDGNTSCNNNEFHFEQMSNVTTTFSATVLNAARNNVFFSSDEGTTLSTTTINRFLTALAGAFFGNDVTVSSTGNANLTINRPSNSSFATLHLATNGTNWVGLQLSTGGSSGDFQISDEQDGGLAFQALRNGTTTISTFGTGTNVVVGKALIASTTLTVNQTTTLPSVTANAVLQTDASHNVVSSPITVIAGTTFINSVPVFDGAGDYIGPNIFMGPTSTAALGSVTQNGGVLLFTQSSTLTGTQFCQGGLFIIASTTATTTITLPSMTQLASSTLTPCASSLYSGSFAQQFVQNSSTFNVTVNTSGTNETQYYSPGTPTVLAPGQRWFVQGQFVNTSTVQGATATGTMLTANYTLYQTSTPFTVSGNTVTVSSTLQVNQTTTIGTGSVTQFQVQGSNGKTYVAAGTTTISAVAAVGGTIAWSTTSTGNGAAASTSIMTYTIPTSTFQGIGDEIDLYAGGTFANTAATNKQVQLQVGSTTVFDTGNSVIAASVAASWFLEARCTMLTTSSTICASQFTNSGSSALTDDSGDAGNKVANSTTTGPIAVTIFGNGTNSNDTVANYFRIVYNPAP